MIVFDIKTGPLPRAQLLAAMPHFDTSEVKVGDLKDPEKIAAKVAEAEPNHEAAFIDRAALSPITGSIIAIGYYDTLSCRHVAEHIGHDEELDYEFTESDVCNSFWVRFNSARCSNQHMVGHNIFGFGVPFILQRSWILKVQPSKHYKDGRGWLNSNVFVDTMRKWQACNYRSTFVKLDTLGKAFGVGQKTEGVAGGMFAELWESNRPLALEYLQNVVTLTANVAQRMGIV